MTGLAGGVTGKPSRHPCPPLRPTQADPSLDTEGYLLGEEAGPGAPWVSVTQGDPGSDWPVGGAAGTCGREARGGCRLFSSLARSVPRGSTLEAAGTFHLLPSAGRGQETGSKPTSYGQAWPRTWAARPLKASTLLQMWAVSQPSPRGPGSGPGMTGRKGAGPCGAAWALGGRKGV